MNPSIPRMLAAAASVVLIALMGFFLFPGHTYLQADTLIYVPMMERAQNPALFTRDFMVSRPHTAYTIYGSTAALLTRATGLELEQVLAGEQIVFRSLFAAGILLIALRLGFRMAAAWWIAATVSLGATIAGPTVLTVEYEPIPRAFAIALVVLAVGLAAHERYLPAGAVASLAFLFHPLTSLPFWVAVVALSVRRRNAVWMLAPLAPALLILLAAGHYESGYALPSLFARLDAAHLAILRTRASYIFVSTWTTQQFADYLLEAALLLFAAWRVRRWLPAPLAAFLWVMPLFGLAMVPLSWLLLDRWGWAYIPVWQPARCVLFLSLGLHVLAAAAGVRAALDRHWPQAAAWQTLAFAIAVKHAAAGPPFRWAPLALAAGLGMLALASTAVPAKYRDAALVFAGLAPFLMIARSGLVENYATLPRTDIESLAAWARAATPQDAVFLFPNARKDVAPAVFRARASRALYVDWKGGGQVNYFPDFAQEWWKRWQETREGRWNVRPVDLRRIAEMGVDYLVVPADRPIPGTEPLFVNPRFRVYPTKAGGS
ncbi:MAG: DUF6798 domain-containing protein [Candidatus Solibacter sp.]